MPLVFTETKQILSSHFIVTIGSAEHYCGGLVAVEELISLITTDYEAYHGTKLPNDFIEIKRVVETVYKYKRV